MPAYSAVAALQLGEAISASATDVLEADVSTYMVEGLQFLVNVIPTDMLWSMETADDFVNVDTGVATFTGLTTVGASNVAATYTDVSLTGGSGTGCIATVIVSTSLTTYVSSVVPTTSGTGYVVSDVLTIPAGTIGGGGGGGTATVATIESDVSTSIDIDTNKILYVLRESDSNLIDTPGSEAGNDAKMLVECREIPASLRGRVTPGSGWKEEVSETDPVWYKLDGKVHILPTSTSLNSKLYWIKVPPTTWSGGADSKVYMSGTILFELEPLLLCYLVKRCLEQKLAKVELGTSSSLEAYIADEDLDLVQAQQVLIGDLLQRITLKDKNMQLMLGALMQGTIQQETADDTKRIPAYSGIAE